MDNNALLVKRYQSGDESALETLIKENEKLVWSVIKHMAVLAGEKEDMFQIGCIGLIKAAKRFDAQKGVMFSTYAVYMIMGEIKKFLRDDGMIKVSRGLKELAAKVKRVSTEIINESGNEPTIAEISQRLGVGEEEVIECLEAVQSPVSINKSIGENDAEFEDFLISDKGFEDEIINKLCLAQETGKLGNREKYVLLMRYFKNKTQSQVAETLGVSQVQVSRIEKKIIEKLKKRIV